MAGTGVTLTLGDRTRLFGDLIGSSELLDSDPRVVAVMAKLEDQVAAAVKEAVLELAQVGDSRRIVREHGNAIARAIAGAPFSEPVGLAVGVIRKAQGMTRAELARRIRRDRGSLARWESGQASRRARWTILDVRAAGEALGYDPTALFLVADEARHTYREAIGDRMSPA